MPAKMEPRPEIQMLLDKALAGKDISRAEAMELMKIDEDSHEMYALGACPIGS